MDYATVMATPVHPVSFASQQEKPLPPEEAEAELNARGSPKLPDAQGRATSSRIASLSSGQNSRTGSPAPGLKVTRGGQSSKDGKGGDPPFDFQKFLDQMKSKSAEPVAKYLKS